MVLRGPGEVLLFGEPPYRERLLTFLSLRRELVERAPAAEHFDLRYRGRIYAKRAAVPPAPVAAAKAKAPPRPREAAAARPPSAAPSSSPNPRLAVRAEADPAVGENH